jgi:hypothetical protein
VVNSLGSICEAVRPSSNLVVGLWICGYYSFPPPEQLNAAVPLHTPAPLTGLLPPPPPPARSVAQTLIRRMLRKAVMTANTALGTLQAMMAQRSRAAASRNHDGLCSRQAIRAIKGSHTIHQLVRMIHAVT